MIDGNATTVILALTGLLATLIGAIIWFAKWAVKNYGNDIKEHTKAAYRLAAASDKMSAAVQKNTLSNIEVLTFMKALNGKLAKATIQTVREQNVEHAHIQMAVMQGPDTVVDSPK